MGTFQSFRKAYGALKDSTKVGLAKVNSEYKVIYDLFIILYVKTHACTSMQTYFLILLKFQYIDWFCSILFIKELDIAIVKATNHVEYPPKERHVRSIYMLKYNLQFLLINIPQNIIILLHFDDIIWHLKKLAHFQSFYSSISVCLFSLLKIIFVPFSLFSCI